MSLLDAIEAIPRKSMIIFLIVENSPRFTESHINIFNSGITSLTETLAGQPPNAVSEIKIAMLEYGPGAVRWLTPTGPEPVEQFKVPLLKPWNADGHSDFSGMCSELCAKLSKNVFMHHAAGCYPPLIVLFSHSENPVLAEDMESLAALHKNNWFKHADISAVAIGKKTDCDLLARFTGDPGNVLYANSPKAFRQIIASINIPRLFMQLPEPKAEIPNAVTIKEMKDTKFFVAATAEDMISDCLEDPDWEIKIEYSEIAKEYKKKISKNFISLCPEKIEEYLSGDHYHVTRKYDGELAVLFFNGTKAYAFNSSGNEFPQLACVDAAAACLKQAEIKNAVLGAELYADESKGRTRVFNTLAALANTNKRSTLQLAFFDILSLDNNGDSVRDYGEIHTTLYGIFNNDKLCIPVKYRFSKTRAEVQAIYDEWVLNEGSEGLVVYGKTQVAVKIKPRVTIDAAVVGFSQGDTPETIRTLLYALAAKDGSYQVVGRTGNGLSEAQKNELWKQLMPLKVQSNYVEVDSNHAAFHFVQPGLVVELCATDVLIENSSGTIRNPLLSWKCNEWKHNGTAAGYSLVAAVITRFRPDKQADSTGVRISQLSGYVHNPHTKPANIKEKSPSLILKREVYQKATSKMSIMKFMAWKTNKDSEQYRIGTFDTSYLSGGYPTYVFSYTNFSVARAEPLAIEVRVSSSEDQILQIYHDFVIKNVTTGWTKEESISALTDYARPDASNLQRLDDPDIKEKYIMHQQPNNAEKGN